MLLAQSGFRTLGTEGNPQAIRDAQKNVVTNNISAPHYIAGKVEIEDALCRHGLKSQNFYSCESFKKRFI